MKITDCFKKHTVPARLSALAPVLFLTAWLWPANNAPTRMLTVAGLLGTWGALLYLVNRRKTRVWATAILLAVPPAVAFLIASAPDRPRKSTLRTAYLAALRGFDGTPYVWGGENAFGMDCSGLPRAALRRALLWRSAAGEPGLLKRMIQNWWFDASARALARSYRAYTVPLNLAGTVASAPESKLSPGDLAISDNGVHVLVYLGPDEWISADPERGGVVIEHPSASKNPWFTRSVHFFRLYELAD